MKYGLIGEKLGHSFSKEIHEKIADYEYELCELDKSAVEGFMRERRFSAINVTIPYKQTVIPYLDEISDKARKIGAVNTVVNKEGRLVGDNTDYDGVVSLIKRVGINPAGKKALVLGTGGTSKTVSAVLSDMGCAEIIKVSRKAGEGTVTYEEAKSLHSDAEIIVNTTPVGMFPKNGECPISIDAFTSLEGVLDVVYNPLETRLVQSAKKRGIKAEGGLFMLAAQAVYASALFTDTNVNPALIESAFESVKRGKENIVLIGMPSCGKSSVGARLSELCGREFHDLDSEIVSASGETIPDIFAKYGEAEFRRMEREAADKFSKKNGVIISCGGGTVTDAENVEKLSQNGVIIFIDRDLERLIATGDRPLSSDRTALEQIYRKRYGIYSSVCDIRVDGNGTVEDTAKAVMSSFFGERGKPYGNNTKGTEK